MDVIIILLAILALAIWEQVGKEVLYKELQDIKARLNSPTPRGGE